MTDTQLDALTRPFPEPEPVIHARGLTPLTGEDHEPSVTDVEIAPSNLKGWVVGLEYCDAHGYHTERVIRISELVNKWDDYYLQSYCYARQAQRIFKITSIISLWVPDTGEIITDDAHTYFESQRIDTFEKASYLYGDYIRALSYIARCDGHFHDAEYDAIVQFCAHLALRATDPVDFDENKIIQKAKSTYLSHIQFKRVIRKIGIGQNRKAFRRAVLSVIEADTVTADKEICLATNIRRWLASAAKEPALQTKDKEDENEMAPGHPDYLKFINAVLKKEKS